MTASNNNKIARYTSQSRQVKTQAPDIIIIVIIIIIIIIIVFIFIIIIIIIIIITSPFCVQRTPNCHRLCWTLKSLYKFVGGH